MGSHKPTRGEGLTTTGCASCCCRKGHGWQTAMSVCAVCMLVLGMQNPEAGMVSGLIFSGKSSSCVHCNQHAFQCLDTRTYCLLCGTGLLPQTRCFEKHPKHTIESCSSMMPSWLTSVRAVLPTEGSPTTATLMLPNSSGLRESAGLAAESALLKKDIQGYYYLRSPGLELPQSSSLQLCKLLLCSCTAAAVVLSSIWCCCSRRW